MRVNSSAVLRFRAAFGLGFIVLGGVTLWRVIVAAAPPNSKIMGGLLAVAMIGLGIARMMQYVRAKRGTPP
ncbi:MAG: hypothetical protein NVS3B7_05120 [Candidatus Elarobacter sp.]